MGTRLTLRGDYDIWRRTELRRDLNGVDLSDDVVIDMSQTTLIDAGAASLLISLCRRLRKQTPDARVILVDAPALVRRVIALCEADDLFVFTSER